MSEVKLSVDEMRTELYKYAFERLAGKIEEKVPANGKFMKFSMALKDPGDKRSVL